MPLRAVGYISQATLPWDRTAFESMVEKAAAFNVQAGVTGVLFFDGLRYLQHLEGPEDGLSVAYQRIRASEEHTEVMELARGTVGRRLLPYWSMRWLLADPSHLKAMVKADWTGFIRSEARTAEPVTAMEHLHRYVAPYVAGEIASNDSLR